MKYRDTQFIITPIDRALRFANPGIVSEKEWIPLYNTSRGLCTEPSRKFFLQALLSTLCNKFFCALEVSFRPTLRRVLTLIARAIRFRALLDWNENTRPKTSKYLLHKALSCLYHLVGYRLAHSGEASGTHPLSRNSEFGIRKSSAWGLFRAPFRFDNSRNATNQRAGPPEKRSLFPLFRMSRLKVVRKIQLAEASINCINPGAP